MATVSRGMINPCITYKIHLDAKGHPIPGTMQGRTNNGHIDKGYGCREAILTNTQMLVPTGHQQCFGKNHLRWFYQVDKLSGRILPNSFFARIGKPRQMCVGHYTILEYIIYN